jgi:hypothetical protein
MSSNDLTGQGKEGKSLQIHLKAGLFVANQKTKLQNLWACIELPL